MKRKAVQADRGAEESTTSKPMATTRRSEGTPLPKVASLHEQTVQAAARGEVFEGPRAQRERTPRCTTIRDERVLPEIMAAALALAEGDASRLTIISVCEVVVHNNKRGS